MAGYQNNPLTKFPLNTSAKGSATLSQPGIHGPVVHTPVGPSPFGSSTHTQLTALPARTVQTSLPPTIKR